MRILIALVIFSAIILIHEFGHFLFAKLNGIEVTEFSLGMGPRIISKEFRGTRYSWKALPIGGSCAMLGEDTDEEHLPGSFNAASTWGRISVVAAGPVFNFILAFIFSVIIVACIGYESPEILQVEKGSAAEAAGIQAGDLIVEYQGYHIDLGKDMYVYNYINPLKEEPITIKVKRDGKTMEITYTPDVDVRYLLGFNRSPSNADSMQIMSLISGYPLEEAGLLPGDVITGINGVKIADGKEYEAYISEHPLSDEPVDITYVRNGLSYDATIVPEEYRTARNGFSYNVACVKTQGIRNVMKYGFLEMKYMIRTTLMSLKELFSGKLKMSDVSGPVGVVNAIGDAYEESKSEGFLMIIMNLMNMAVLLSANLGVMNLLPLPALDGGRLVFLFLEAIRRKPVNRNLEASIHFTGLVLLMLLMVVIMYFDILKLF